MNTLVSIGTTFKCNSYIPTLNCKLFSSKKLLKISNYQISNKVIQIK